MKLGIWDVYYPIYGKLDEIYHYLLSIMNNINEYNYVGKKWQFSSIVPKFSQICKIISKNFEDILLEQIIIDKYTVGILNNIDIYENIETFVHILSSFNVIITLIAKINIVIFMV